MSQTRKFVFPLCIAALLSLVCKTDALDNGLALTPPMGFNNWQRFRCNTDCKNYPDTCISEKLFMTIADAMVARGYLDAGYNYVNVDDCWVSDERDATTGRLEPNPDRFPSGMKALADYVHSKGLKFGLYQDVGVKTCAGYPGLKGFEKVDAQIYAEWGVDYVKVDGCNIDPKEFDNLYPLFGRELNATGRPILYSCEWPWYQVRPNISTNFTAVRETCNMWRNYEDIEDSFESLKFTMDWMGKNNEQFRAVSGPGGWNDPDMLDIGDYGLSLQQSQAQFALWAIMAAPLLISADVRNMRPELEQILLNRDIIAVSQDPLGIMGERIDNGSKNGGVEIWRRPITPTNNVAAGETIYSYALAFWCRSLNGYPIMIEKSLAELGLNNANGYTIKNLYGNSSEDSQDVYKAEDTLQLFIKPSGGIIMLRATIATPVNDQILRRARNKLRDQVLPYYDATQLVAKAAWEELQRNSGRRHHKLPEEEEQLHTLDDLVIVYPVEQSDADEQYPYEYETATSSKWIALQRYQIREKFWTIVQKVQHCVFHNHISATSVVYVLVWTIFMTVCITLFVLIRVCGVRSQPKVPENAASKTYIEKKGQRITSAAKKLVAAPNSLSAQIDARRGNHQIQGATNDVFLPQMCVDEYDDGFDEEHDADDAHRYVGTVEAGQYVRL